MILVTADSTLCAYLVTTHGRAMPLAWKTVKKSKLAGKRTDRHGHAEGDRGTRVRAVLHDEGTAGGVGARAGGRVRHRAAASLSFRPGAFPPPFLATVMQAKGPLRAGPRVALRFARLDKAMHERHARYPHWYLWLLGVEPECQGRGLGSLLLRSLSSKAEADGAPCYLETGAPQNVPLYERHGYRVEGDETLPGVGVRFCFMKRT